MTQRTIKVEQLARVEGEGALHVRLRDGAIEHVELNIYEPPRFFEALLRGRDFREAADITARICGICPVAYQMSAVHAMEAACGVRVGGALRDLRRLLYCGEWIESHVLHIHMLHAPDFLGFDSVVEMARDHRAAVQRALRMKKAGNDIVATLGGREVHPINVRVGGFYRAPRKSALAALRDELLWARDAARETVLWTAALDCPDFERDYTFVALRPQDEYPLAEGRIASSGGIDIAPDDYEDTFEEVHVAHSTALHAQIRGGGPYLTGPLARYALNFERLPETVRATARDAGLGPVCRNPFRSIVVRAVEVLFAFEEALRLIDAYAPPAEPAVPVTPRDGRGAWATEAPRGLLFHRYDIAADGSIQSARIVPPTAQNQPTIEDDLRGVLAANLSMADEALKLRCEQTIRNYDPCISCATHFLRLDIDRGEDGS
ncbi:Ni/Fe hydrogenase subunit alpha [Microbaculum marinisediminis]|uniref:Nickel-dependent hydrogenase large subunit n=1 Tax=Microbaculum marinisediminis TaxID=2931392 RepID=A0AAW5R2A3_9HYPH|nr:nickel-dependent hydrogenase large subunit [Microbaculum sp. A6E488]MCT8973480.1 nickel-dependent hydrogenase large subunit [Microbaculum sp. A6E488]